MDSSLDPNRYATGAEAADITARLAEQRALLKVMRATNARAEANLDEMRTQLREVNFQCLLANERYNAAEAYSRIAKEQYRAQRDLVKTQRLFLHPVRKTPIEVLGRIFEYCLPDFNTLDVLPEQAPPFMRNQSFALAAVCRRWRLASLASPRAWSFLHLAFDGIEHDKLESWNVMVECIVSRSSRALLDLFITRERFPRPLDGTLTGIVQLLSQAMRRCRTLRLYIDALHENDYLAPILSANLPNLVTTRLRVPDATTEEFSPLHNATIFRGSSKLKHIDCSREFLAALSPLPTVVQLRAEHPAILHTVDHLAIALSKTPNVHTLHLTQLWVPEDVQTSNILVFSRVRDLTVGVTEETNVQLLCETLKFPEMQHVMIVGEEWTCPGRIALVQNLCNPNKLDSMQFGDLSMEDVDAFIEAFEP